MLPSPQPTQPQANDQQTLDRNKQRGTGFTNINKTLAANQGAGQKMGQQIGSSLANQAGQVKQGIQQGQSQFQAGMQTGSAGANQAIQGGQQLQQQSGETPEAYAARLAGQKSEDLSTQGKALQGAAYTGPQGLQNASQITSQAATAGALGRLGATSAGQGQLLASQVAQRGNYGRGQSALDQMLLGRGGQQAIQQGRSALTGIQNQAQGAVQSAAGQAGATGQAIDANKTAALQALNTGMQGFQNQAKQQATDYNAQGTKLQSMLQGKNPDGTVIDATHPSQYSPEDLALLDSMDQYGLNGSQNIYGSGNVSSSNALNQFTKDLDTSQQNRYTGNQGAAIGNLASFLGDDATKTAAGQQFNDKIFSGVTNQNATQANAAAQAADEAARARSGTQLGLKQQMDRFLYNAAHPLGTGVNAMNRVHSDMAQVGNYQNQLQSQGFDPNQSAAAIQGDIANSTGQQKSMRQLALERLGQTYTPPLQTEVNPSKTRTQK